MWRKCSRTRSRSTKLCVLWCGLSARSATQIMDSSIEIPLSPDSREVAKWIWRNLVPKSGQCETIQGELLRAIEKLLWEAQTNGNINWDHGFEKLLVFLDRTLCGEPKFDERLKQSLRDDLNLLRDYERPYTAEDLYDRLTEGVVEFCRIHPHLLPKPHDPTLHR